MMYQIDLKPKFRNYKEEKEEREKEDGNPVEAIENFYKFYYNCFTLLKGCRFVKEGSSFPAHVVTDENGNKVYPKDAFFPLNIKTTKIDPGVISNGINFAYKNIDKIIASIESYKENDEEKDYLDSVAISNDIIQWISEISRNWGIAACFKGENKTFDKSGAWPLRDFLRNKIGNFKNEYDKITSRLKEKHGYDSEKFSLDKALECVKNDEYNKSKCTKEIYDYNWLNAVSSLSLDSLGFKNSLKEGYV